MRPGGGKQKGAAFEREVCKALSLWISARKKEDIFWRSAMSGGRATVARQRGRNADSALGDISAVDALGAALLSKFLTECKFYGDLSIIGLFTRSGKLYDFWTILKREASLVNREPFLIAKQNRLPAFVLLTNNGQILLHLEGVPMALFPKINACFIWFDDFLNEAVIYKTPSDQKRLKLKPKE